MPLVLAQDSEVCARRHMRRRRAHYCRRNSLGCASTDGRRQGMKVSSILEEANMRPSGMKLHTWASARRRGRCGAGERRGSGARDGRALDAGVTYSIPPVLYGKRLRKENRAHSRQLKPGMTSSARKCGAGKIASRLPGRSQSLSKEVCSGSAGEVGILHLQIDHVRRQVLEEVVPHSRRCAGRQGALSRYHGDRRHSAALKSSTRASSTRAGDGQHAHRRPHPLCR